MFFMYISTILILLILGGFLGTIPRLLNATFEIEKLIYELSISYYRFQCAIDNPENSETYCEQLHLVLMKNLRTMDENKFLTRIKEAEPDIETPINHLHELLHYFTQTGLPQYAVNIQDELALLISAVRKYSDRQKYALSVSLYAALFVLISLSLLVFYLYHHNRRMIAKLEKAVLERDYLIKEVHHRVKNNLAIVSSLISLKSANLSDKSVLSDIQQQISAISTIHESLYQVESISEVPFQFYTSRLLRTIFFSLSSIPVLLEIEAGGITVPPKQMVPLGLIITELATNAVKYGFQGREERIFTVSMTGGVQEDFYRLVVSNSGNRFPDDISLETCTSMGIQLIHTLVHQLEGSITLEREPRTTFILDIPVL